jgi:hypothetical protein
MRKSTMFGTENQQVDVSRILYQFALDIPWTFTYHTQARGQKCAPCGMGMSVGLG